MLKNFPRKYIKSKRDGNKKDKIKDLDNQSWRSNCWLIGILEDSGVREWRKLSRNNTPKIFQS